jgi:hypothetical protein
MIGEQDTATLIIQKPLNEAVKLLRRALAEGGLEICRGSRLGGSHQEVPPDCFPTVQGSMHRLPRGATGGTGPRSIGRRPAPAALGGYRPGRLNSGSLFESCRRAL